MDHKYIVALELSGSQVKGTVASVGVHPNGAMSLPTIDAIVAENSNDCVQYGRVQNLINAAKLTKKVINRLQDEPALANGIIEDAYVGISGRSLGSETVTAEINLPTEMFITEDILRNLYIEAAKMASQDKRVLKVLPKKYIVDNQTMPKPVGAMGRRLRGEFTLVICNPISQRNLDLVFTDKDNIPISIKQYIPTPLAIADMVLDEEEKQLGCVLIDLGWQTTTISIYKDRALQYLTTLPMGSYNITRDIYSGMNMTMEKAEAAKCTYGDATPAQTQGSDDVTRMNAYVAARAYEIVINITTFITNYAKYEPADLPKGFILTGRGARLKNFDTLLASQSKMNVRAASLPSNINFAPGTKNIHPDDFISLISMVMYVGRNPDFKNCVKITQPIISEEKPVVEAPKPQKDLNDVNDEDRFQPKPEEKQKKNEPDEKDWMKDDNEDIENIEVQTPKKKKKRTIFNISSLKNKVIDLVSKTDFEDNDLDQ